MNHELLGLHLRRDFFSHCLPNLKGSGRGDGTFMDNTCPCCGYPTLTERAGYEVCRICAWEDDGQDNHNEDEKQVALTEKSH